MSRLTAPEFADILHDPYLGGSFEDATSQTVLEADSLVARLLKSAGVNPNTFAESDTYRTFSVASALIARQLGVSPGDRSVIVNGRVCIP